MIRSLIIFIVFIPLNFALAKNVAKTKKSTSNTPIKHNKLITVGMSTLALDDDLANGINFDFLWQRKSQHYWGFTAYHQVGEIKQENDYCCFSNDFKYQMFSFGLKYIREVPVRRKSARDVAYIEVGLANIEKSGNGYGRRDKDVLYIEPGFLSTHSINKRFAFTWGFGLLIIPDDETDDVPWPSSPDPLDFEAGDYSGFKIKLQADYIF